MSKKWQLPLQKGTDANPQVTRQPPKVVVPGVGGDPELHARVVAEYSGALGSFHAAQMQKYALSTSPVQGGRRYLPDAKMSYWNNNGQETLRLEVAPEKLEQLKQQGPQTYLPWDWAMVDLRVANPTGSIYVVAFQVGPTADIVGDMDTPHKGVAISNEADCDTSLNPVLQFPRNKFDTAVGVISSDGVGASLLVDLRGLPPDGVIHADLYALMDRGVTPHYGIRGSVAMVRRHGQGLPDDASLRDELEIINGDASWSADDFTALYEAFPELAGLPHTGNTDDGYAGASSTYNINQPLEGYYRQSAFFWHWSTFAPIGWRGFSWPTYPDDFDFTTIAATYPPISETTYWSGGVPKTVEYQNSFDNVTPMSEDLLYSSVPRDIGNEIGDTGDILFGNIPVDTRSWVTHYWETHTGSFNHLVTYYRPYYGWSYDTDPPTTRAGTLWARFFRGTPVWQRTDCIDDAMGAWEHWSVFNDPKDDGGGNALTLMKQLRAEVTVVCDDAAADTSLANHRGFPYLGRLMVSRQYGAVAFKPA